NPKVQDYNIALAKFVAQSGADEIQFDYVRFPAEGDQKDASFVYQTEHPEAEAETQPCKEVQPESPSPGEPALSLSKGAADNSPALKRRVAGKNGNKSRRDGTNIPLRNTACSA